MGIGPARGFGFAIRSTSAVRRTQAWALAPKWNRLDRLCERVRWRGYRNSMSPNMESNTVMGLGHHGFNDRNTESRARPRDQHFRLSSYPMGKVDYSTQ